MDGFLLRRLGLSSFNQSNQRIQQCKTNVLNDEECGESAKRIPQRIFPIKTEWNVVGKRNNREGKWPGRGGKSFVNRRNGRGAPS